MTFKYQEGDSVALKEDHNDFLPAGTCGVIFCYYTTTPPAYEVNFMLSDGDEFGAIMFEDDIEAAYSQPLSVQREAVGASL